MNGPTDSREIPAFRLDVALRCVACRMVLTGTVAEVADRYRNHQCVERWYPIVDLPSLYTHVGVKK